MGWIAEEANTMQPSPLPLTDTMIARYLFDLIVIDATPIGRQQEVVVRLGMTHLEEHRE